jgi:CheY-like chemotaxis protein
MRRGQTMGEGTMNNISMKNILVVDDSKTVCRLIGSDLMAHGYNVACAQSMEDAIKCKEYKTFDLMITDLVMPGMGGIEGIKLIRQKYPDIAIIAMTGGSGADDAANLLAKARFVGADDLVLKPFEMDDLREKVAMHCVAYTGKAKPKKILVVDDSTTVQKVVLKMLAKGGYNAVCASSIEEALERLDIVRVDLVITDIFMPGKGGIVGIRELRENWPETKIVAMSGGMEGLGGGDAIEAAKRVGADVGLQKPFDEAKLNGVVKDLVG